MHLLAGKIELDAGLVVGSIASGTKIRTSRLKIFVGLKSRARDVEQKLELGDIRTVL